jgi:hypothetical protein
LLLVFVQGAARLFGRLKLPGIVRSTLAGLPQMIGTRSRVYGR